VTEDMDESGVKVEELWETPDSDTDTVAIESLGTNMRLPRLDAGGKEVVVCTGPASYAKSGFAYGWTKSGRPRNDRGDDDRDASVTSVGLNVLEYIDGSGDVERVGAGEAAEANVEPTTEPGLRGGGWGIMVSGVAVCDMVLERPREKISPGREGREEDVAGIVVCGCALGTIKINFTRKIGQMRRTHCILAVDIGLSKEILSLPVAVDSMLGRGADVALEEAVLPKPFIKPSPRALLLLRLVTKERVSSSCSGPSLMRSSVSQGAGEWKRIVGPRKLIRDSGSSSSVCIDSGEELRSLRRISVVERAQSVARPRVSVI